MNSLACPDPHDLQRLALGQLAETEADRLGTHVLNCATCAERLNSLQAPDHLASDLRAFGQLMPTLSRGDSLVEKLIPLGDAEAAATQDPAATVPTTVAGGSTPAPASEAFPAIAGYEMLRMLGRGGMGVVYQARQISLKRLVALKMIRAGTHAGAKERTRFRTEAEAVAALQHPNIVQIYEIGEQAGCPYFSLEYVDGGSLDRRLTKGPLPFPEVARLVEILARAMHHCHQRGIIHRDLKPANVLLTPDNTPKITDFGLAKQLGDDLAQTQSVAIMGTPCYMAPEQAAGQIRAVGPAADIYALGAILYELLSGRPPFRGDNMAVILEQVRTQEPVPPSRLRARLPRDLETICIKALAKEPGQRYSSALTLAQDLERFQGGDPILARREWLVRKVLRKLGRHRIAAACVMLALIVGSTIALMAVAKSDHINTVARTIDAGLAAPELTDAYLEQMEGHIARMEAKDAYRADVARQRLRQVLAEFIRKRLSQPTVPPEEFARIDAFLDSLARRQWVVVSELRRDVKDRRANWETVFHLMPPNTGSDEVFDAGRVTAQDGALIAQAPRLPSKPANAVFSRKSCAGNVELEAVFPKGWDSASEVGLSFGGHPGHTEPITALVFCPDGKTLVSASGAKDRWGEVRFWDIAAIQERAVYWPDRPGRLFVAVARDGRVIVANSNDPVVRLLDPATGLVLDRFTAHETGVSAVAFSSDGKTLATGGGVADKSGEVRFWDAVTWQRRDTLSAHADVVESIAFSADDRHLATGAHDRTVILWDLPKRKPLVTTFPIWKIAPPLLRFTPGGKTLLAVARPNKDSENVEFIEWDLTDATPHSRGPIVPGSSIGTSALACSPDGKLVASAATWGFHEVFLRATADGTPRSFGRIPAHDQTFTALEFSPDGSALVVGGSDGSVEMWDRGTRRLRAAFRGEGYTFLLRSPAPAAGAAQKPPARPSMRAVRKANGSLVVQILRNSTRLREVTLPATQIAHGSLRLTARRHGNRLTFRVGELAPVEFEDVVPLHSATASVFGLRWPGGLRLEQVRASRQVLPMVASLLERGDDFYARGRYAEALGCYREQVLSAGNSEAGQEARAKSALCLKQLDRPKEAADLFVHVVNNGGRRWPLVAACNLLMLQLDQDNLEAADDALEVLATRFDNVNFNTVIPDDFGEQIVEKCNPDLGMFALHLAPAPAKILSKLQRAKKAQDIFASQSLAPRRMQMNFVLAYHLAGQTDRALQAAEELLADEEFWTAFGKDTDKGKGFYANLLEHYCWLQRTRGKPAVALARIDKELFKGPDVPNAALAFLFLPRSRLHIALGQWDQAEKDLEAYFRLAPDGSGTYHEVPRANLLLGFLRERRGDGAGALDAWRRGLFSTWCRTHAQAAYAHSTTLPNPAFFRHYNWAAGRVSRRYADEEVTTFLHALILATLAGDLPDAEAEIPLRTLLLHAQGAVPGIILREATRLAPPTLLRDMWRTPRGRACARQLAFLDIPFAESLRMPWLLATYETIHHAVFPGDLSVDQDQVMWQLVSELHTAYTTNKLSAFQLGSLLLTWKGTTGQLAWQGVAPNLNGSLRGPLGYVFGRRYRQLKKPKEADDFFRAALKDAPADSPLNRLAQGALNGKE